MVNRKYAFYESVNKNFKPCPTEDGDEIYQNGIFKFNTSKLIEYIKINSDKVDLIEVEIEDSPKEFSSEWKKLVKWE